MALDLAALKAQVRRLPEDTNDDTILQRLLDAAKVKVEADLGYKLTNADKLPEGAPADLELAVLMTAADWYQNREANLVGVTAIPLPMGVPEIIANYRDYSFGGVIVDG